MKVILVGGNDLTFYMIKDLISKGYEVTVINPDQKICERFEEGTKGLIICGDGSNPDVLEEGGAYKADILVALTSSDPDNLFVCQLAQKRFQVPKVLALLNNPANRETFRKLGITSLFNVTQILSILIQQNLAAEDITNLMSIENGGVSIYQIVVETSAAAVGKKVKDLQLPKNAVLGAILRSEEVIIPKGDTELAEGDKILVISLPDVQAEVYQVLVGREE